MKLSKRGVELPSSTIIVFVLLAIALAVLAYFFLTGAARTTGTISDIFKSSTAGVSRDLAIETCNQRCDKIQDYSLTTARLSAFCTGSFKIDSNGNGQPDMYLDTKTDKNLPIQYYCDITPAIDGSTNSLGIQCLINVKNKDGSVTPTPLDCNKQ
ncbi:MAG: hypothetical protein Q7R56_03580 [Nanoarchaeota archaeon]|nr:hypothetical protein [Nanoarchaeota archaeon]